MKTGVCLGFVIVCVCLGIFFFKNGSKTSLGRLTLLPPPLECLLLTGAGITVVYHSAWLYEVALRIKHCGIRKADAAGLKVQGQSGI